VSIPIPVTKNQTRIESNFQNWKLELELESTFFEELNWEPDLCGNRIPINRIYGAKPWWLSNCLPNVLESNKYIAS